ncbi:MAG: hypothetical protein NTX66_03360 [Candidatus Falkowbacteria bacterium]|nr:hypothetical protein [Candidatus Falkowbacteria bacterium]
MVKRLEYEALINPALKSNLPGLRERINEQLSDPKIKLAYKRELRRLLSN